MIQVLEDNNNGMSAIKAGVIPTSTGWKPGMVNPTVTITSENSPTEEHYHWSKTPITMGRYTPIAFDERVTFCLQRAGSLPCACVFAALYACPSLCDCVMIIHNPTRK